MVAGVQKGTQRAKLSLFSLLSVTSAQIWDEGGRCVGMRVGGVLGLMTCVNGGRGEVPLKVCGCIGERGGTH